MKYHFMLIRLAKYKNGETVGEWEVSRTDTVMEIITTTAKSNLAMTRKVKNAHSVRPISSTPRYILSSKNFFTYTQEMDTRMFTPALLIMTGN